MPLSLLDQLVDREIVCYMDRVRLNAGRDGLGVWFGYVHATVRERQISVDIDICKIETVEPGLFHVSGTVVTRHGENRRETVPFVLTYLVQKGRAMKVWSTRSNYVSVLGRSIELPLYVGFLYHCLRAWCYDASH